MKVFALQLIQAVILSMAMLSNALMAASPQPAVNQHQNQQQPQHQQQTFVVVHGATGGGWDWKQVAKQLRAKGHDVYRVTLTGLGERYHLANDSVNLTTHINDVVNTITFEQLDKVVLVGHSYGGMVISGVMNEIPDKVSHAIFLDALVPAHGMNALQILSMKYEDLPIKDGLTYFPWLSADAPYPKDVPHPAKTLSQPVTFNNPKLADINTSYIGFVPQGNSVTERKRNDKSWQLAEKRGWTIRVFAGDHVVYRIKPEQMAQLLIDSLSDRNTSPNK
ncbi:alpha/beta hydrolase [Thalassotalea sp. HSM 43]|uniref:alpha/beta hydrolase n=1 Tax=Thalassotalea sp. HSM 43 TaxID=2552945 RepID=UPI001E322DBD|nr:alpha/beta hydrolase family protein [Thalassotalea sp. HSM 43]